MEKQLQQQQQKKTQPAGPTVEDQKEVLEKSKKWPMFYPNYINNQRTIAQGRKIPKSQCCANPTSLEIVHIANALKLPWVHERYKLYPRAFMLKPGQMMLPGRVRVQLWNEDKTPINEKIPTRTAFMKFAGENIPNLKIRHQRIQHAQAQMQAHQAAVEKAQAKKSKKGKKGKKGKRR
mmetsp:Transcript_25456/g.45231  ORF Transcript_25456/g.45231 Transcript_25456/m.45231 type:complete len:178 (+) Transcript_25456:254-787(+)|eukprot:CAMPEP_0197527706 /NCGR_PEP_ID=MMETSP1318-20131121/22619_1 /TAXON_ID=552666 /ORGANISM="Partenskyella glossopodia, Strain RCC365" /LENGTH=177 /DNA_ID=CAMNT_0043082489 /DNA_START=240 /DNA_END=773 /DNA_ORIENTATION=+